MRLGLGVGFQAGLAQGPRRAGPDAGQTRPRAADGLGPDGGGHVLERLRAVIAARARERPPGSYTVDLLDHGTVKISQKVGEEAVEVVVAANAEGRDRLASESADLLYHLLVLLQSTGVPADDVWRELARRAR